jgi:broad specificity phosphatase PhoE
VTRILLIRHGESEANSERIFAGNKDVKLMERGIEQAKKTAEYISEFYDVDCVYASDLVRAHKTGEVIAGFLGLKVITDRRLREIYAGEWEGKKFSDLEKNYSKDYTCWLTDIGNCICTGGESVKELGLRVFKAISEIAEKNDGKTVVIATHATPIRVLQCILGGYSFDSMKNIPWVSNASVTELSYECGQWNFIKVCQDEHLSELKTSFPANV